MILYHTGAWSRAIYSNIIDAFMSTLMRQILMDARSRDAQTVKELSASYVVAGTPWQGVA